MIVITMDPYGPYTFCHTGEPWSVWGGLAQNFVVVCDENGEPLNNLLLS